MEVKIRYCTIGEEVTIISSGSYPFLNGRTGCVLNYGFDFASIGVEFDNPIPGGHSCDGSGKLGHCWYVESSAIVALSCFEHDDHIFDDIDACAIDMFLQRFEKKGCAKNGNI